MAQLRLREAAARVPWDYLRSPFFESRAPSERSRIVRQCLAVSERLHWWMLRYPLVSRVRVGPLALAVAAAAPFADVEALFLTARLRLWLDALADLFDQRFLTETDLERRLDGYRAVARARPLGQAALPTDDLLAEALRGVRDDLAAFPLFSAFEVEWMAAVDGAIDALHREHRWSVAYQLSDASALPGYEDYLANGRFSVGGPAYSCTAAIVADDRSAVTHAAHLRKLTVLAATCLCLARDSRRHAPDVAVGRIRVNAVSVLRQVLVARGSPAEAALVEALALVRAEIDRGLATLAMEGEFARTRTGYPEAAIADLAHFSCEFYTHDDRHTIETGPSLSA
jgi:hypothetical protein